LEEIPCLIVSCFYYTVYRVLEAAQLYLEVVFSTFSLVLSFDAGYTSMGIDVEK
jgi:hypothetical protein